jgi:hypothetical protein
MYSGRTGTVEPDLLGDIHSGDLQQGRGVSTSQLGRVTVGLSGGDWEGPPGYTADDYDAIARARASNSTLQNVIDTFRSSPAVWLTVIAILVIIKWLAEKDGKASEFSTVRIGAENIVLVTLMAMVGTFVIKTSVALVPSDGPTAMAVREFVGVAT